MIRLKVAVTVLAELIVKAQLEPVQAPVKPANSDPAPASAISVRAVPAGYLAVHAPGEPAPTLHLTVPVPVPALLTVRANSVAGLRLNVAVTELFALSVNEQGEVEQLLAEPVPELKPAKVEPELAVAMIWTAVPFG